MALGTQNIGFAVPIDLAKEVLGELKAKGKVSRPWLGAVSYTHLTLPTSDLV